MSELLLEEGDTCLLQGEIEIDGMYYTPESGTLSMSISNIWGSTLVSNVENLAYPYEIPAEQFTLSDGTLVGGFIVRIGFQCEGLQYYKKLSVTVQKPMPLLFTKQDVLNTLNAPDTMTERDIDLAYAYSKVSEEVGNTFFTKPENHASDSRLVFLKSIITVLPTYSMRVLQTKRIDDHTETRFRLDVDGLTEKFQAEYNLILASAYDINYEVDTLVSLVSRDDVITGES